ncbi:Os09g0485950, partial [Oryza sativa Japonica Group]
TEQSVICKREAFTDRLDDLPPLGRVLPEPLRAPPLHHLGRPGRHGSERRAPNARLLPEQRPLVGPLRVRAVAAGLLDVHQRPEVGVAGDHPHGPCGPVHGGVLDAEHHVGGGDEAAEEERERRRPPRDGAHGVDAPRSSVDAAGQRVHLEDVRQRRRPRVRVRELAPRRRGHPVPRVAVHVLLRVRDHHAGRPAAACLCARASRRAEIERG